MKKEKQEPKEKIQDLHEERTVFEGINELVKLCHGRSVNGGWWTDVKTGEDLHGKRNPAELLCLVHSEISESMEGFRRDRMDDKLPNRKMAEVELADAIIRIADIAGGFGFDLAGAILEKLEYNKNREDHKLANRAKEDGKKF